MQGRRMITAGPFFFSWGTLYCHPRFRGDDNLGDAANNWGAVIEMPPI